MVSISRVVVRVRGIRGRNKLARRRKESAVRSISATMSVTLDGVVQGLGRPDEDTRGGFTHGGWGLRYQDEVMGEEMGKGMTTP